MPEWWANNQPRRRVLRRLPSATRGHRAAKGDGEALRRLGQRVSSVLKQQGREACTDSVVMLACKGWASRQAAASEADSLRAARHKTAGGELTAHESFTPQRRTQHRQPVLLSDAPVQTGSAPNGWRRARPLGLTCRIPYTGLALVQANARMAPQRVFQGTAQFPGAFRCLFKQAKVASLLGVRLRPRSKPHVARGNRALAEADRLVLLLRLHRSKRGSGFEKVSLFCELVPGGQMANCTNLTQQWLRHVAICKLHRSGGYAHTLMDSAKSKSKTGRGLRHVAKVLCCVVKQTAVAMQKNSDLGTAASNLGSGAPPFLAGTRVSVLTRLTDAMLASSLVPVQHASLAPLAHVGSAVV